MSEKPVAKFFIPERQLRRYLWWIYVLLIAWQLVWHLLWAPPQKLSLALVLSLAIVPLLPALLLRSYQPAFAVVMAGFAALVHLLFASMEAAMGGPARGPALVQTLITMSYFALWAKLITLEKQSLKR